MVSFRTPGLAIFAVALIVRLIHVAQMRNTPFLTVLMGDSRGYDLWAREIAGGAWIGRDVFYQAPLYPYFLGLLYTLTGRDLLLVRAVQAVAGAVSCVALGYAAARLLSNRVGLVAGLMLALYPPAIFFDGLLQKSVLDVLFVCVSLALVALILSPEGPHRRGLWFALGVAMGALTLTRENALVLVAVILAWSLVYESGIARPAHAQSGRKKKPRARPKRGVGPAMLLAGGLATVLLPVVVRNYAVGGGLYLTTSQFGSNLFIGNNPLADGSYMSLRPGRGSPEFERLDATELAEQAKGRRLTPSEVSSYWTGRTLEFIQTQPGAWLRLIARKAMLLSSGSEIIDTESQESHQEYSIPLRVLGRVWHFGILLPIAGLGMCALWPERRRLWPIYALTAAYAASVILFFVVARYRLPLVPFLILFASAFAVTAREWLSKAPRRHLIAASAVSLVFAVASNWPQHSADARRAITENNLGTALQEDGRPAEAVERYKRALAFDASYTPALNNLGTALRAMGRVDEAVATYGDAIARGADAASVHYNLANALAAQGRRAEAIAEYRRALAINPSLPDAHNNLGQALAAEGQLDEAIRSFRQAVQLDDASPVAHGNLANALASAGALDEAIREFQRAVALAPADAGLRYDLGSALVEAGGWGAATSALREALRLKPDYPEAHNNLGIALASQGQVAEAVRHWKEAVRLKPDFADARVNLERAGVKP